LSTGRAQRILESPILLTLARLAALGAALALIQTAVSVTESAFAGA